MVLNRRGRTVARALAALLAAVAVLAVARALGPAPGEASAGPGATARPGTTMWSARRVPGPVVALARAQVRAASVAEVLAGYDGCIAADDRSGPLVRLRASEPLIPASAQKLLTGLSALQTFGPDHRLRTDARPTVPVRNGTIDGDLVVVGGGDPTLATERFRASLAGSARTRDDVTTPIEQLADAVVAAGVTRITGAVLGEDSAFEALRFLPSWKESYAGEAGPIGALAVDHGYTDFGSRIRAEDPAVHAASVLSDLLAQRGVDIGAAAGRADAAPAQAPIASVRSAPMSDLVTTMLTSSDNFVAEMLTRAVSVEIDGAPGTTIGGTAHVPRALGAEGIPADGVAMVDGSGLSRDNRATCTALLDTLEAARAPSGRYRVLESGLATAGETGTLAARFLGSGLEGRLHAKTGTLDGVVALVGVIDGADGLRFAFVGNGAFGEATGFQLQQDVVGRLTAAEDASAGITLPSPG